MLRVRDLEAFYGPSQALFGKELGIDAGEVVTLMGRNGMGTLFGPLFGTIAFFVLEESLPPLLNLFAKGWGEYWQIVFGPMLILIALYVRGGIDSLFGRRS